MREIKFRAWDKEKNEMYSPTFEAYKGNLFELMVSFSGDLSAHTMKGMEHESLFPQRFILMQYTGLKDKNGREIYEGDIVEKDLLDQRGVVLWFAPTYAGYIIFHPENGYIPSDWRGTYNELDGRHGAFGSTHKPRVIGNIYENPELLEKS